MKKSFYRIVALTALAAGPGQSVTDGSGLLFLVQATTAEARDERIGVGVATEGEFSGKLVRYNPSGAAVPLRAFGVNYYDAFLRYLKNSNDTTFVQGFDYLSTNHIPVVRVLGAGFWPADWGLYFQNKTEYYRRLDFFVAQAEQYGVGLILDLFWSVTTPGEIVDDAVAAGYLVPGVDFVPDDPLNLDTNGLPTYAEYTRDFGRTNSGSNAFITYYTREVVSRYANSPAIWGWEFGNEYNLKVDHPNVLLRDRQGGRTQGMTLPGTSTNLTLLPAWTGPDDLTRADVTVAKKNFAGTVRSIDTWRLIMTGDAEALPTAYSNWTAHTWGLSSRAQFAQVIAADNPDVFDVITVHTYPGKPTDTKPTVFFTDNPITNQWVTGQYKERLDYYVATSAALGRPLVVGEWGAIGDGTTADEKTTFNRFMQALIDSGVQLSLMWDFDSRTTQQTNTWWIQTGMVPGYPASPKLYTITNTDTNLWDIKQANDVYGQW